MADIARKPPRNIGNMVKRTISSDDPITIGSAHNRVSDAIGRIEGIVQAPRVVRTGINLLVGANTINHGLGRKPLGCNVTHTTTDAGFDWALTSADDKQATLTVIGAGAQSNCTVEFY